jgi:plastocyanin
VHERQLLLAGLALVAAGLMGMSVAGPWGGWWDGMRHGPIMGWWAGQPEAHSAPAIAGAPTLVVDAVDFAFQPDRLQVSVSEEFNLTLVSRGALLHDLSIPDLDVQVVVRPGDSVTVGVAAPPPGEYRMLCTVPGHAEAGMVGLLVIEDS